MLRPILVIGALIGVVGAAIYLGAMYLWLRGEEDPREDHPAFVDWPARYGDEYISSVSLSPSPSPYRAESGHVIGGDPCLEVGLVLEVREGETTTPITKARVEWKTKPWWGNEEDWPMEWESAGSTVEIMTGGYGWMEALLPQSGRLRLTYNWPWGNDWNWADKVRYRFRITTWSPEGTEEFVTSVKEAIITCGTPATPRLDWEHSTACECLDEPADMPVVLLEPQDGELVTSGDAYPTKQLVLFKWEAVDWVPPDWEHAYLLEVWYGDSVAQGDECFATYYLDPNPPCVLVVNTKETHYTHAFQQYSANYANDFSWRVRAQCCEGGVLRYGTPSAIRTFTIPPLDDGSDDCCDTVTAKSPPNPTGPDPADPVKEAPILTWSAVSGMPSGTIYQVQIKKSFMNWCDADNANLSINGNDCWTRSVVGATTFDAEVLEPYGLSQGFGYDWRVRAWCPDAGVDDCHTPWSVEWTFFYE